MAIIAGTLLLLEILFDILTENLQNVVLVWLYLAVFAISFVCLMIFLKKLAAELSFYQNTLFNSKRLSSGATYVLVYMIFKIASLLLISYVPLGVLFLFVLLFGPPIIKAVAFSKTYNSLKDFEYKGLVVFSVYAWTELVTMVLAFFMFLGEAESAGYTIVSIGFWVDIALLTLIAIVLIAQANKFSIISQFASTIPPKQVPGYAPVQPIYQPTQPTYQYQAPQPQTPQSTTPLIPQTEEPIAKIPDRFCTNCGAKVNPSDKFCVQCGAKLE